MYYNTNVANVDFPICYIFICAFAMAKHVIYCTKFAHIIDLNLIVLIFVSRKLTYQIVSLYKNRYYKVDTKGRSKVSDTPVLMSSKYNAYRLDSKT